MTETQAATATNYVQRAIAAVTAQMPDQDPALLRLYALLALTKGAKVALEDVHDAWAVWRLETRPGHPSIIPFYELTLDVQELDRPYMDAIRRAAENLDAPQRAEDPSPAPPGEFARVDIMGHDSRTGWVSDGSLAGAACLDVRNAAGDLVAKIPPQSVYMYSPLLPPGARDSRPAIESGPDPADVTWESDEAYDAIAGGKEPWE